MRERLLALLPGMSRRRRPSHPAVVCALRAAHRARGCPVPGLPTTRGRDRPRAVPVQRAGPRRRPPAEVLRLAGGGRGARDRDGRCSAARWSPRGGGLGAALPPTARGARVRPGRRARAGRRAAARPAGPGPSPSRHKHLAAGPARRRGEAGRDGWGVPRRGPTAAASAARRRRPDDRSDRGGVCPRAPRSRSAFGLPAHGCASGIRAATRSVYSVGLTPGSVVARGGSSPVVDASRGRSDPRKATLGC